MRKVEHLHLVLHHAVAPGMFQRAAGVAGHPCCIFDPRLPGAPLGQFASPKVGKVGITGWAQVNGWRGDTSIEKRVEYDLYYLQNWSLAFDLRIIVMTVLSALINKNAY
jgi:hypothetical protein